MHHLQGKGPDLFRLSTRENQNCTEILGRNSHASLAVVPFSPWPLLASGELTGRSPANPEGGGDLVVG